jgi:hypothetical protein
MAAYCATTTNELLIIYNNMKKKHKNVVLPVLPIQFILQVKT